MALPAPKTFEEFKQRVLHLCALHCCSETSGARTYKRNLAVGGATTSKHLLEYGAMATDLVPDDNTAETRLALCRAAKRLGLFVQDEGNHVHLQGLPPGPLG